eukprot:jgi/Ulvmu1/5139/UM021_0156.1
MTTQSQELLESMRPVLVGFALAFVLLVACAFAVKCVCKHWRITSRIGWTVVFEVQDVPIPAQWLTGNCLLPSPDCVIKRTICSVELYPLLRIRAPAVHVSVTGVTVRLGIQHSPSTSSSIARELLRYLDTIDSILFARSWVFQWCRALHQRLATMTVCIGLFIVAHCVAVDMHDISMQICTGLRHHPSNTTTPAVHATGSAVDIHVARLKLHSARLGRETSSLSLCTAQMLVAVMGVDVACVCLPSGSPCKIMKRWAMEATLKIGKQGAAGFTVADIYIDATVVTKAIILQATAAEIWVFQDMIQAYARCQALNKYAGHRPDNGVQADPAAWWRYAVRSVLHHICAYPNEPYWPVHHIRKLPALLQEYALQRKQPGKVLLWEGDHDMTLRQSCMLRVLAWYVSSAHDLRNSSKKVAIAQTKVHALLAGSDAREARKLFSLNLNGRCPRIGFELCVDGVPTTVLTMTDSNVLLKLEQWLQTGPTRLTNDCVAHTSVGRLLIEQSTSGKLVNVIDSPAAPSWAHHACHEAPFLIADLRLPEQLVGAECNIQMATTKFSYEATAVRHLLSSIVHMMSSRHTAYDISCLRQYVFQQLKARNSMRTQLQSHRTSMPVVFQCQHVYVLAHCDKGTCLLMKLSMVRASYNSLKPFSYEGSAISLRHPLNKTTADVASPKISAINQGHQTSESSTVSPSLGVSTSRRVVMQSPSTSRFRSKWQAQFLPSSCDIQQKLVVKACIEVEQINHCSPSIESEPLLDQVQCDLTLMEQLQPGLKIQSTQNVTVVLQPILSCNLTVNMLENLKGLCESLSALTPVMCGRQMQRAESMACRVEQAIANDATTPAPAQHVVLMQCYIPQVKLSCSHTERSSRFESSGAVQPKHGACLATLNIHRLLFSGTFACHCRIRAQIAALSIDVTNSQYVDVPPLVSRMVCTHSASVIRNLSVLHMQRSEKALLATVLRQWCTTCQVTIPCYVCGSYSRIVLP